jgi:hypothetical protein
MNLNLLILVRVKITFMIQTTKIDRHLQWPQLGAPLSIYLQFYGKLM